MGKDGGGYMGMNSEKNSKSNIRTSLSDSHFVRQVQGLLKDWDIKVMSYVMIVIVSIAMIAATVAWFTYFHVVAISNMGLTAAECKSVKVEVKQGATEGGKNNFVELKEGEEDSVFVDIDMPVFNNVEEYEITEKNTSTDTRQVSKMAPGVYGSITIRLTSLNKDVNMYRITPVTLFKYINEDWDSVTETGKVDISALNEIAVLQQLAKGHILFFKDREQITESNTSIANNISYITIGQETKPITDYTHNQKYVYYNQIESGNRVTGELLWNDTQNEGQPTEITLYWYWPYEYDNLSSTIQSSIQLPDSSDLLSQITTDSTKLMYFDKAKMEEIVTDSISWNETQLYDYADTRIGTYVRNIKIHLKVDGYHAAE